MDIKQEIAVLQKMTVAQLRQRHVDLFNEPTCHAIARGCSDG